MFYVDHTFSVSVLIFLFVSSPASFAVSRLPHLISSTKFSESILSSSSFNLKLANGGYQLITDWWSKVLIFLILGRGGKIFSSLHRVELGLEFA